MSVTALCSARHLRIDGILIERAGLTVTRRGLRWTLTAANSAAERWLHRHAFDRRTFLTRAGATRFAAGQLMTCPLPALDRTPRAEITYIGEGMYVTACGKFSVTRAGRRWAVRDVTAQVTFYEPSVDQARRLIAVLAPAR